MFTKQISTMFLTWRHLLLRIRTSTRALVHIGVAATGFGLAMAAAAGESSLNDVRHQLDEMLAAANAHDTNRFTAMYAHTPDLILVFDDQKITGWQAARDQQEKWWNEGKTDLVYALRSPVEVAQVDAGVIVTFQRLASTRTASDGTKRTKNLNATSVWRKGSDGWKIVIAHESFVE